MNTSIEQGIQAAIQTQLESAYPYEACGFLLGLEKDHKRIITRSIEVENKSTENQRRRFIINPLDYLKTEKLALNEGLTLLGIYHSHPDHPAIPSVYDLEYAQPFFSYFIFSIVSGKLVNTRSYRLFDEKFIAEEFSISEQKKSKIVNPCFDFAQQPK